MGQHQLVARGSPPGSSRGFDLLLTPTLGEPPPPLGSFDDSGDDPVAALLRGAQTATFTPDGLRALSYLAHNQDRFPKGRPFFLNAA